MAIRRKGGDNMFNNNLYNLFAQITEEHKSLWRIKNQYTEDAAGYDKCREFWKKMEKDKENHIKELTELIKEHICS